MLFLNTHAACPSASLKAFNNYFYYQDKLKNVFSFPTKTFSVYIAVSQELGIYFLTLQKNSCGLGSRFARGLMRNLYHIQASLKSDQLPLTLEMLKDKKCLDFTWCFPRCLNSAFVDKQKCCAIGQAECLASLLAQTHLRILSQLSSPLDLLWKAFSKHVY